MRNVFIIILGVILWNPINTFGKIQVKEANLSVDWNLILVNKSYRLNDDYEVKTEKFTNEKSVDARIIKDLQAMFSDAKKAGINLKFISGYRSISYQKILFDRRVKEYMEKGLKKEAAQEKTELYLAPPGASEHHTGLACDILSEEWKKGLIEDFETTEAFKWLVKNCANYGFILRYPKGKEKITQINYEPWHYRYVGKLAAKEIMAKEITLEEFLKK